jgi:hypothetical protein
MRGDWADIERLGRKLGASGEAIRKWRTRGVPAKWQLKIMAADPKAKIARTAFNNPPRRASIEAA